MCTKCVLVTFHVMRFFGQNEDAEEEAQIFEQATTADCHRSVSIIDSSFLCYARVYFASATFWLSTLPFLNIAWLCFFLYIVCLMTVANIM